MVALHTKGFSESCKNICSKHGIQMHVKWGKTIRDLRVTQEHKDTILQKKGVIYRYKCGRVDCEEEYIGESGTRFRTLQGCLTDLLPPQHHRSYHNLSKPHHCLKGGSKPCYINQRGHPERANDQSLSRNIGNVCHTYCMRFCLTHQNLNSKRTPINVSH